MDAVAVLSDSFGRIRDVVTAVVDGLSPEELARRPDGSANSIGWLIWHLTRVQDDHVADAAGTGQVWSAGWYDRFGLDLVESDTGYGHSAAQVAQVRTSAELLAGYHDAVQQRTSRFLSTLDDARLERVVDVSWEPPVTLGVRLVSVISDDLMHAGQAHYVRGLMQRARSTGTG